MQLQNRVLRRTALAVMAAGLAAAVVVTAALAQSPTAASTRSATKLTKVTETGFKVISIAPVYTAIDHGDFKRHGLDFTLQEIQSGALGLSTVLSGNAQFTDLGVNDVLDLYNQGKKVQLFYNLEKSLTMDMVFAKSVAQEKGITPSSPLTAKFQALKGLKIGITRPGAPTDIYPRYFMKQVGLNPDSDATFIPIGDAASLVGALQAGRIDAFMLSPPGPYVAESQGFGTVMIKGSQSLPVFKTYDFTSVAVMKSYADSHPGIMKAYVAAVQDASKWMMTHRAQALQLLHDKHFSDTDMPTLKISFDHFMDTLNPTGQMTRAGVANQVTVLQSMDQLQGSTPLANGVLWTDKWTKAVAAKKPAKKK
jgi:NitT/TauT family transport system substrate-binding protein